MSWRDRLRPASFRGVPFLIEGHETEGGRKVARHDFFRRETAPYFQDLGRRGNVIRFDAYVLAGPSGDYFDERDALKAALDREGAGRLVHPYLGEIEVRSENYRLEEKTGDGRMARFSLTFEETGAPTAPEERADTAGLAGEAATTAGAAAGAAATEELEVQGVPEFARTAIEDELANLGDVLSGLQVFTGAAQDVAVFGKSTAALITQAASYALAPVDLVAAVNAAITEISAAAGTSLDALRAYGGIFGLEPVTPKPGGTATQLRAEANAQAVVDLARALAVAEAVRAAALVDWESADEAEDEAATILAELDALAETTTDDALYQALEDLRTRLVNAVPPPDANLPRIRTFTPPIDLPALAIAHDLYGDPFRADEIVARNKVAHPAFVAGQEPLDVLIADA